MTVGELIAKLSCFPGNDLVEESFSMTNGTCDLIIKDPFGERESVSIHTIHAPAPPVIEITETTT